MSSPKTPKTPKATGRGRLENVLPTSGAFPPVQDHPPDGLNSWLCKLGAIYGHFRGWRGEGEDDVCVVFLMMTCFVVFVKYLKNLANVGKYDNEMRIVSLKIR